MDIHASIFLLILILTQVNGHLKVVQHSVPDLPTKTYFYETQSSSDFKSATTWCKQLGGNLPIIHNIDDLTFLTNKVIASQPGSTDTSKTWLGLVKKDSLCGSWLDDTSVNITFNWIANEGCEHCHEHCCAMYLSSGSVNGQTKMGITSCAQNGKMVCVVDGDSLDPVSLTQMMQDIEEQLKHMSGMAEQSQEEFLTANQQLLLVQHQIQLLTDWIAEHDDKMLNLTVSHDNEMKNGIKSLTKNLWTTNALLWTILSIILCVVIISGLANCCSRTDDGNDMHETSVAYVTGEERVNYGYGNSPPPQIPTPSCSSSNFKANNLYYGREPCSL